MNPTSMRAMPATGRGARAISAYILYRRRSGGRATWSATAMINAVLAAELHGRARTCNPTPRSWRRACLIRIPAADAREHRDVLLAVVLVGHHVADDAGRGL